MNRLLILCFVLLASCAKKQYANYFDSVMNSTGSTEIEQEPDYLSSRPFQILWADSVLNLRSQLYLDPLDFLLEKDSLGLNKYSHLILTHYSGMFIEFSGDTIISISNLAKNINYKLRQTIDEYDTRFPVQKLWSDREDRTGDIATGAVTICFPRDITILSPPSSEVEINWFYPNLFLEWEAFADEVSDQFEITIESIFNERLETIKVDGYSLKHDFSKYSETNPIGLFIVQIADRKNPELKSKRIGVRIKKESELYYNLDSLTNPVRYLQSAAYAEYNKDILYAEEMYKKASEISNLDAYQFFYDQFKKRNALLLQE